VAKMMAERMGIWTTRLKERKKGKRRRNMQMS